MKPKKRMIYCYIIITFGLLIVLYFGNSGIDFLTGRWLNESVRQVAADLMRLYGTLAAVIAAGVIFVRENNKK